MSRSFGLLGAAAIFLALAGAAQAAFVGYVDLAGTVGGAGGNSLNTLHLNLPFVSAETSTASGTLIDFASGDSTGVLLEVTGYRVAGSGEAPNSFAGNGTASSPGTDAHTIFDGRVNMAGVLNYAQDDTYTEFRFTNLDPMRLYEFVITGNRAGNYTPSRMGNFTISGVDGFENTSSIGATISGTNSETTTFNVGNNTTAGLVARFTDINVGADGEFMIRLDGYRYYANGLRLSDVGAVPEPASLAVLGLGAMALLRRRHA